ncbi:MAG TPA: flavin reductase family protein [Stenomitos sp.]
MTAPSMPLSTQFESGDFRKALGTFCTGVTVVTTPKGEEVVGMTANSFTSVSLSPALVLVSVGKQSGMNALIQESKVFGVTILAADQEDVSNHFAGKKDPQVEATLSYLWHEGVPMVESGMANLACRLWATYDGGDHTLYLGEVLALRTIKTAGPLLYFGGYRRLG